MESIANLVRELEGRAGIQERIGRLEAADKQFGGGIPAGYILRFTSAGAFASSYPVTAAGFAAAIAAASSGDVITVPPATITGNVTIPANVKIVGESRYGTILTGQITGSSGSSLENLSVIRTANDSSILKGVVAPSSGTMYISDCDIECTQSGSGDARAISGESGGSIEAWSCFLYGSAVSGTGLAAFRTGGGAIYIYGGKARGSTVTFNE